MGCGKTSAEQSVAKFVRRSKTKDRKLIFQQIMRFLRARTNKRWRY